MSAKKTVSNLRQGIVVDKTFSNHLKRNVIFVGIMRQWFAIITCARVLVQQLAILPPQK